MMNADILKTVSGKELLVTSHAGCEAAMKEGLPAVGVSGCTLDDINRIQRSGAIVKLSFSDDDPGKFQKQQWMKALRKKPKRFGEGMGINWVTLLGEKKASELAEAIAKGDTWN
jgi:hypothetical protein